jgi:hypothetical protein
MESLDDPSAFATSDLAGSPLVSPWPHPRSRVSCCSPQVPCVSGALTRSATMRFPFLVCMSLPPLHLLPMLQLHCLPTATIKFPFQVLCTILLWLCMVVMTRFLSSAQDFPVFTPSFTLPLFKRDQPRRLAAMTDALSGMVPRAAGMAEEQTMEDVQPGKITGRIGNYGGSNVVVASGAGVGRSWVSRMTWQTIQGCQGGNHCETWPKLQLWQEWPAGTTDGRAGRVYAACEPKGRHSRRYLHTYA